MRPSPPAHRRRRSVRPLLALRRHPRAWWLLVAAAALLIGWLVAAAVGRAEQAARGWGEPVTVAVAARDLEAGHELRHGDVRLERWPGRLVPEGALDDVPAGRSLHAAVYEGEALVADRLASPGARGLAALLDDGERAVSVPVEPGLAPPLDAGDHVDVVVALAPEAAAGGPPGFTLVTGALVLDVGELAVTVAVPADAAPRIAVALSQGAVTLALTGP